MECLCTAWYWTLYMRHWAVTNWATPELVKKKKKKPRLHMLRQWSNSCFTGNHVTRVTSDTPDLLVLLMLPHVQDYRPPRVECTSYSNVECNEEREMHKTRKGKEWCSLFSFLAVKYLISQYDIHSKLPEFRLQLKYLKLGHRVGTVQLLWPFILFSFLHCMYYRS